MCNDTGEIIYVGKAKNLKNRVASYFVGKNDAKTQHMMTLVVDIQITITRTESEALLLEYQLITQWKPRYNILFRDDKSYPYIYLTTQEDFPQLRSYRGNAKEKGVFFGPYPSGKTVRESIDLLHRVFRLRQCDLTYFKARTRPCLQYQIKRCTAPCVGYIDKDTYQQDVESVLKFLSGKTDSVIGDLLDAMDQASKKYHYEHAARIRDQISALKNVQKQQIITDPAQHKNIDVLGIEQLGKHICIHLLTIRDGRMLGSRQYFPKKELLLKRTKQEVLESFIMQHYMKDINQKMRAQEILIPVELENSSSLENTLHLKISFNLRGDRRKWVNMAQISATEALNSRIAGDAKVHSQLNELATVLNLELIERVECFDVSHTQGEATIAACVVLDQTGEVRSDYRKYKIKQAVAGDDYAAMEEALRRHFRKITDLSLEKPDLLLIDGGKGQLTRAERVCLELGINGVQLLGIAKGPSRKPGLEKLYTSSAGDEINLESDSGALHLLQRIRDEAHRFAITGHRKQRAKRSTHSILEDIDGVGPAKRRELLRRFGGLQELQCATLDELEGVPGISSVLAKRIYDALNRN